MGNSLEQANTSQPSFFLICSRSLLSSDCKMLIDHRDKHSFFYPSVILYPQCQCLLMYPQLGPGPGAAVLYFTRIKYCVSNFQKKQAIAGPASLPAFLILNFDICYHHVFIPKALDLFNQFLDSEPYQIK